MQFLHFVGTNIGFLSIIFILLLVIIGLVFVLLREKMQKASAENEAEKNRQFYNAYLHHKGDVYLLIQKKDLRVLFITPNLVDFCGLQSDFVSADLEHFRNAVSPKTARTFISQLKAWDGTGILSEEFSFHMPNEPAENESHRGKFFLTTDDSNTQYFVTLQDITKEYAIRQELLESLAQSQQESQSKTDFLSQMSHEIRTPMNGILGMLSLARMHLQETEALQEHLEKAESLSQFLLSLINDILDMSRIESGKMELEQVPFDLFGVAGKLNAMFQNTVEAKGIKWTVEMQDFDVRYIIGDELRLSQVIINFISNSSKFTPAGGSITVTFRQMHKIDGRLHLMVRVRDTGKGIKREFIDRIFRPFEQESASTAHHYGGSGLGMAIADNIVRLMQGQIMVESEEGKGTEIVVYVSLPIAEGDQTLPADPLDTMGDSKEVVAVPDDFTLEGIRILLAEDNEINAEIAIEILESEGAVMTHAEDGIQVVDLFANSPVGSFDVILMDIQMPGRDGWEATEVIRKLDRPDATIPIFAMSANAFIEDKRHSLEVGMNGHISKPVDFDEVRQIVGETLLHR